MLSRLSSGKIRITEPVSQNLFLKVQGEWCVHADTMRCHGPGGQFRSQSRGEGRVYRQPEKVNGIPGAHGVNPDEKKGLRRGRRTAERLLANEAAP